MAKRYAQSDSPTPGERTTSFAKGVFPYLVGVAVIIAALVYVFNNAPEPPASTASPSPAPIPITTPSNPVQPHPTTTDPEPETQSAPAGKVWVKGHTRNGKWVEGHWRSK